MNLLSPTDGEKLIARDQVIRPGRTLIVTQIDVYAVLYAKETMCALIQQTNMVKQGKARK